MMTKQHVVALFMVLVLFFSQVPQVLADGNDPVAIENQNLIVYPVDPNTMGVVQVMAIKNTGSEKEDTLKLYLPDGYQNLEIRVGLNKDKIKKTEQGIVDQIGLAAGQTKNITISYEMPMKNGASRWTVEQAYLAKRINVVIQAGVMNFQAVGLVTQSERIEMNGQQFRKFTRLDLHPDTPWTLSFDLIERLEDGGAPAEADENAAPSNPEKTADGNAILGHVHGGEYGKAIFTIIVIIIALTAALIGLKRDGARISRKQRKGKRSWLQTEKNNLLKQISQLEKDYSSQLISEQTYSSAKAELRNQLVRIKLETSGE